MQASTHKWKYEGLIVKKIVLYALLAFLVVASWSLLTDDSEPMKRIDLNRQIKPAKIAPSPKPGKL